MYLVKLFILRGGSEKKKGLQKFPWGAIKEKEPNSKNQRCVSTAETFQLFHTRVFLLVSFDSYFFWLLKRIILREEEVLNGEQSNDRNQNSSSHPPNTSS